MDHFDVHGVTAGVDRALAVVENPRHRHILKNYRRHGLLEVSGLWEQILVPEMTVEHPVYRLTENGRRHVLDGMDAVAGFYRGITESRNNVGVLLDEEVGVSDTGLFSECRMSYVWPGDAPALAGDNVDPDCCYEVTSWVSMRWPYVGGRLAGEHVYEDSASRTVTEVDCSAFTTPEQAREILAPYLADSPLDELVAGLQLFR